MAELWEVHGTVEAGPVDFPEPQRTSAKFMAARWQDAVHAAPEHLLASQPTGVQVLDISEIRRLHTNVRT